MNTKLLFFYSELINSITTDPINNNAHEKLENFVKDLIEYCSKEENIFASFRFLREIKSDITLKKKFLSGNNSYEIEYLINKLIVYLATELDVIRYKISNPNLINLEYLKPDIPELLHWTGKKVDLVELVYAIAKSINGGKASMSKIFRCFEFIFQINLGNYYDILGEINLRKSNTTRYLDSLPENIYSILESLNN